MNSNTIRAGLVGHCASSFVQGLQFYRDAADGDELPGLMNARVGRYHVSDVEVSAAFDVNVDKVEVWDSPNSAGVVIDAVRCARLALDRGLGGAIVGPSSYVMKSPPQQFPDHVARELTLEFIGAAACEPEEETDGHRTGAPRYVRAHE